MILGYMGSLSNQYTLQPRRKMDRTIFRRLEQVEMDKDHDLACLQC